MVVGSGLIATSFSAYCGVEEVTVFASGVSDSSCVDRSSYDRERDLLLSQDFSRKIVYFSTYSISDGSEINDYINHKREMESIVESSFCDWIILRLPTVVGRGGNPNNFFNYIAGRLVKCLPVDVRDGVYRSLIDADHLLPLTEWIIDNMSRVRVNVSLDNQSLVYDLVSQMKDLLCSTSEIRLVDGHRNRPVENDFIRSNSPAFGRFDRHDYNLELFKKYLNYEA